jgi:hypothetical protein
MPSYTLIELSNKSLEFTTRKVTSPELFSGQVHRSPWGYFVYTMMTLERDVEFNKQRLLDEMIRDSATLLKEVGERLKKLNTLKKERGERIP